MLDDGSRTRWSEAADSIANPPATRHASFEHVSEEHDTIDQ